MTGFSLRSLPAWRKAYVQPNPTLEFQGYCPPRCAHNAVCVNEDLLVWGGYSDENIEAVYCPNNLLWMFNVDLDCWFCYRTQGQFPASRTGASSALLWPNWYIFSGNSYDGDESDTFMLNLLTLTWEKLDCKPCYRLSRDKASAWTWNDRIYIFGGYGSPVDDDLWNKEDDHFVLEVFKGWNDQLVYLDCDKKEWIRPRYKGKKPSPRAAHTTVCINDVVYLFGGRFLTERMNDLHFMDMQTHTWSGKIAIAGEQPCGRSWHTMTKINQSDILLFGGFSTQNMPLDDAWILNTKALSWSVLNKKTGVPRLWHTACVNSQGDTLVFGGCSSNILDDSTRMETSDKVVLFRTDPLKLVRMCLHIISKHRQRTESQWEELPLIFQEWLKIKNQNLDSFRLHFLGSNIIVGHGPGLNDLRCDNAH